MAISNVRTGMNTSSESPEPSRLAVNVPADESALSSYEMEELLTLAITALRKVTLAAYKAHAREHTLRFLQGLPTTLEQEPVSQFTQRLTHFYGLLGTQLEELRSIAQTGPATDAIDSSRGQEWHEWSRLTRRPFYRTDEMEELDAYSDEPPMYSIVIDDTGDAWHRRWEGWTCAVPGEGGEYDNWSWSRLTTRYPRLRFLYRTS